MVDSLRSSDAGKLRVLVVDDEDCVRAVCVRTLRQDGHEVHEAVDAFSAMRIASRMAFDVAVVDLCMPEEDGDAVMRQLRWIQPGIGLVGMSGWQAREARDRCVSAGAEIFLQKPQASLDTLALAVLGVAPRKSA